MDDIEQIVLELGEITADNLLGKDIKQYYKNIITNIKILNLLIAELDESTESYEFLVTLAYNYYLMKDVALKAI